jgi:hypothetical protein
VGGERAALASMVSFAQSTRTGPARRRFFSTSRDSCASDAWSV